MLRVTDMPHPEPIFRLAVAADVSALVEPLADDILGQARESSPNDPIYAEAFAEP